MATLVKLSGGHTELSMKRLKLDRSPHHTGSKDWIKNALGCDLKLAKYGSVFNDLRVFQTFYSQLILFLR